MIRLSALLFTVIVPGVALSAQPDAEQVLAESRIRGGLVVKLGCGDGKLAADLSRGGRFLVHGLDKDPTNVARAREYLSGLGIYGQVSVVQFDGDRLPYTDNLVNLIVADAPVDVSKEEILRVLTPFGEAYLKQSDRWQRIVKPRPDDMDEWTHFLHAADGNAVSRDRQVGHPQRLRWVDDPVFSRHHDEVLATSAMVTGGGRLFSMVDEAPRATFHPAIGGKFFLIARDAFNGLELWRKPITDWGWKSWGNRQNVRFSQPIQLPKRMVVQGDRLYVTLGWNAPVSVLDAQTGEVVEVLSETDYADELLVVDGKLVLSVYNHPIRPIEALAEGSERAEPNPLGIGKRIVVVDLSSGRKLWQSDVLNGLRARFDAVSPQTHLELTVRSGKVFAITEDAVQCFSLQDGQPLWDAPRPSHPVHRMNLGVNMGDNCTVVADDERLYVAQPVGRLRNNFHTIPCDLYAYDVQDGRQLWKLEGKIGSFAWGIHADVFLIDGRLWSHEHIAAEMRGADPVDQDSIAYCLLAINAKTGEIERRIDTRTIFNVAHHHRCYRNNATERFVLSARRGTELIDIESGELFINHWLRGECRFGMVPANGLLYSPPDPCSCHARIKVNGMLALAEGETPDEDTTPRLAKGPAIGSVSETFNGPSDWPMHRANSRRQGRTETVIETLSEKWQVDLGDAITQAICVGDRVFVGCRDTHRVQSLNLKDGEKLWNFIASGRIDSPPTFHNGRLLFGSADGCVYCLRADDGQLVWRFRAAPSTSLIMARGQLESAWPVHGSILVEKGQAYVVAGRSSYLDGGLYAFALDAGTGKILRQRRILSAHSDERLDHSQQTFDADGALNQLLVSDGETVYLQGKPLFDDGAADAPAEPFLMATCGMLDGSMFNRYGWAIVGASEITGTQIAHDEQLAYTTRATASFGRSTTFFVGSGYSLAEVDLPVQSGTFAQFEKNAFSGLGYRAPKAKPNWQCKIPVRGQAMLLASNALLIAGFEDKISEEDPYAVFEGRQGGTLLIIDRNTGKIRSEVTLDSPPVWDGMSCASEHVFLSLDDGTVVCYDSRIEQ